MNTCAMLRIALLSLLWALVPTPTSAFAADDARYQRTEDIIYGRKFGTALTLDEFRPKEANGKAIVFIVSGGWFSSHEGINAGMFAPMLDHGYTVFAVVHGSQPKFTIPEIVQDMNRSIRFIRHNARRFEIDPDRIGSIGASAGGHLSLTLATQGGPGKADAKDPVDRESSAVQAAVAFFPPTDFLNYGEPGVDAVGIGPLKDFRAPFGPRAATEEGRQELGKGVSPINFVHPGMPPILLFHGDADKLVPIQQSQLFVERCHAAQVPVELVVRHGKGHGWADMGRDVTTAVDFFDRNLLATPK